MNRALRRTWREALGAWDRIESSKVLSYGLGGMDGRSGGVNAATKLRAVLSMFLASIVAAAALVMAVSAQAQPQTPETLTGALAKARQTGTIAIGYRETSVPFAFHNARKEPVGYSIELCRELVKAVEDTLNKSLMIKWVVVTSESRFEAIESGAIDLECGSTTNNLERQKRVSFSPTMFVAGTKVLVKKGSPIRSTSDLAGKRVAVLANSTNQQLLQDLSEKSKLGIQLVAAHDEHAAFALLKNGQADAFATDDVLLHGLLARDAAKAEYEMLRSYLSYEPYGIMYRKGDAQLGKVINDTFRVLAEDGEIDRQYKRWFLRTLPTGESLNLPMNARLEAIVQQMAGKSRRAAVAPAAEPRPCRPWRARRSAAQHTRPK